MLVRRRHVLARIYTAPQKSEPTINMT